LALILICILLPLVIIAQNKGYFLQKFAAYQIYENFSNSQDQDSVNSEFFKIQDYLFLKNSQLDSDFFSIEDRIHLNDVRSTFILVYIILLIAILYLVIYIWQTSKKQKIVTITYLISKNALIVLIVIILILFPIFNANFPKFFQLFHQVLFPQGFWRLDPNSSNLIKYFLNNIFLDILNLLGILTLILTFIPYIFSIILLKIRSYGK